MSHHSTLSYGTTNVGIATKRFLVLSTDKRVTGDDGWLHDAVLNDNDNKLFEISKISTLYITAFGSVRPWDDMYDHIKQVVSKEEQKTKKLISVEDLKKMIEDYCENRNPWTSKTASFGGILAGWPLGGVDQMFYFEACGKQTYFEEVIVDSPNFNYVAGGSGAPTTIEILQKFQKVPCRSIFEAFLVDPATGGGAKVGCIEEGHYTQMFDGDSLDVLKVCFEKNLVEDLEVAFLFETIKVGWGDLNEVTLKNKFRGLKINITGAEIILNTDKFKLWIIKTLTKADREVLLSGVDHNLESVTTYKELLPRITRIDIYGREYHISAVDQAMVKLVDMFRRA